MKEQIYSDAVLSQVGIGCLELKHITQDGIVTQEINLYSKHGEAKGEWGTKIFTGSLFELVEFIRQARTAIAIINQIGEMVNKNR